MTAPADIARLKITLEDVEPLVMRRVEVPLAIRLDRLHAVLQTAIGWTNSRLWEFRAGGTGWGIPDRVRGDGPHDAAKAKLIDVLEDAGTRSLAYLYDFGDGWEHTVRVERAVAAEPGARLHRGAARPCRSRHGADPAAVSVLRLCRDGPQRRPKLAQPGGQPPGSTGAPRGTRRVVWYRRSPCCS